MMTVSADEGVRDSRDSDAKQDADRGNVHYGPYHYDPYDADLNRDPYPMFARIREHAPL